MRFKLLISFFIIWFLRGIIIEYGMGMSADSPASSDPTLYKLIFEGLIMIMFISSIKKILISKFDIKLLIVIIFYLLLSIISAVFNEVEIINSIKYSRYLIYSFVLYLTVKTIPFTATRIKLLFKTLTYLFVFQIIISIINLLIYGPFESRIGSMLLMSGELGTIFPITALAFAIPYYHLINRKTYIIIISWLFLLVGFSTGKRAALFVFPIFFILFNIAVYRLYKMSSKRQLKILIFIALMLLFASPLILYYLNNVYLGSGVFDSGDFSENNLQSSLNFLYEYSFNFKGDGLTTGRLSTTFNLILSLFEINYNSFFGYGPMILFSEEIRGYGSGFTILNVLYGIVGWSRDYISVGIFSVILMIIYYYLIYSRFKFFFRFRNNFSKELNFILVSGIFSLYIVIFDYLFYSAVTFVSGIPIFLTTICLGLSENLIKNNDLIHESLTLNK